MKKPFLLTFLVFACCIQIDAQDTRLVGTWKCHREAVMGDGEHYCWDNYIRIEMEDNHLYVRLKQITNINGKEHQDRTEGEHIVINSDGSISFDDYLSKKEYDNEDHLYWTVWYHYVIRYGGGRLNVSQKLMGEGRNRNGYLVKDERDNHSVEHKIYYNEKDNW